MNKLITLLSILLLASCSDWLDVEPKTSIEEKDLFKNEQGFKEALTGAYIKLASEPLYGKNLSYGFVDFLAQRYAVYDSQYDFSKGKWYNFEPASDNTKNYTDPIWSNAYNLIANVNNLIANIDEKSNVIYTEGLRNIIKGEALGLRGFVYFDLLRLWGPIYKDNASSPAIPYRTQFDRTTAKLLPASKVAELIIADLKEAEQLLADDRMDISFPIYNETSTENPFLIRRFKRMNKYAVKAELARVYLYIGDKANAAKYAQEVIDARKANGSRLFSLITDCATDHLGSTELIFSISMDSKSFGTTVKNDFLISNVSAYFINSTERVNQLFDVAVDGSNDMRMKEGVGFDLNAQGGVTRKYVQDNFSKVLNNTIPLIRLPEMYYILAECTGDLKQSSNYLSTVRSTRGIEDVTLATEEERQLAIEKEYRKEFYAEGQLWYFYKRNGYKTFQFCPVSTELTEANYRFGIPDDETLLGNIN